jgi:tetratricopeptide (TPR) repeat protein
VGDALDYLHQYWAAQDEIGGPLRGDQMRLQSMGAYAVGGMTDIALDSIRAIEARLGDAFGILAALGYLEVAVEIDSVSLIQQAIDDTEALIARFAIDLVRPLLLRARGRLAELRDHCDDALPLYEEALALSPTMYDFEVDIARCEGVTGHLGEAERRLRTLLAQRPALPRARYELAIVLAEQGDSAAARSELDRALEIWRDADPGFVPAQEARALREELKPGD